MMFLDDKLAPWVEYENGSYTLKAGAPADVKEMYQEFITLLNENGKVDKDGIVTQY